MPTLTFENVYPRAPFAELIRLGIALGGLLARWRDKGGEAAMPTHVAMSH